MSKLWAFILLCVEIGDFVKRFFKIKKEKEIDEAVDKGEYIENVINSESANHPSKYTGDDGVFDVTDEDQH